MHANHAPQAMSHDDGPVHGQRRTNGAVRRSQESSLRDHRLLPSRPIDYSDAGSPAVSVRLQELFGTRETPTVLGGRVALTLHLLSPAQRPVQVTRDLAGFWRSSYFDVRKDMRARYPKHEWPEDPLSAPPTRRAKPRKT